MDILGIATKFSIMLFVICLITIFFQKIGTTGFYLTLASMVITCVISAIGIVVLVKRNKKEEEKNENK